jgi:hypothetical protein
MLFISNINLDKHWRHARTSGEIPSFSWFRQPQYHNCVVTDWQIRVDIPMLMMYPNTHRMISDKSKIPANVINSDGTLKGRFRRVMESFKVK